MTNVMDASTNLKDSQSFIDFLNVSIHRHRSLFRVTNSML